MLRRATERLIKEKQALIRQWRTLASEAEIAGTTATPSATSPTPPLTSPPSPGSLAHVPAIVKALGFGGALPFWVFSPPIAQKLPLDLLGDVFSANPALTQAAYGATIVSFLGGVHWGLAMTSVTPRQMVSQRFVWSVVPCLMAWPTLALPPGQAAGTQAALLAIVYVADRHWARKGLLPPWYMALRSRLTLLAAGGLVLTAAASDDGKMGDGDVK
jgi:hypothetical protein